MRNKVDPKLGQQIREHLQSSGLETLISSPDRGVAFTAMRVGVFDFLKGIGLDPENDPSLKETPQRIADMFVWELCQGLDYDTFPKCTTTPNGTPLDLGYFKGAYNEMVRLSNIHTISFCEHHFQTIAGRTHIAYIPDRKLLGVSKLPRVTRFFARRPQIQERMTEQIHAALCFILETDDVAVQQTCIHNCIRARGVEDPHSDMTTSKLGGRFMTKPELRQEFLHGIK